MAQFLLSVGTQIVFADHAGDFAPTAANDLRQGTPTTAQLALVSVLNNAARQSAKVDLGANRARLYSVMAALEFAAMPTALLGVNFWWGPSSDSVAANGNVGNLSGSDAAYTGYSSNLDNSLTQLIRIGTFVNTAQATATVQVAMVGVFSPPERYGSLVVVNRSGAALHSNDVQMHVTVTPIIDESV